MTDKINQIFDKAFKRILLLSHVAVINFINGLFEKDFPLDSELTYNETETIDNDLGKTVADIIITINATEKFHLEAQINNDNTIVVRVFIYGLSEALRYRVERADRIVLNFPMPKIIFLEHNANTPDVVMLDLNFAEQGTFTYKVPTMKFLTYSVDELDKRHMVILLPLYLLKLRKEIAKEATRENALALKKLLDVEIMKAIDENEKAGHITREDSIDLISLLGKLYEYLYGDVELFKQERVKSMLADRLILDSDIAREEGVKDVAREMLKEGDSVERVARLTKLSIDEIKQLKAQMKTLAL